MELAQNMPDPTLLGVMLPTDQVGWFLTFAYKDVGHVADDEQGSLNADEILTAFRTGTEAANAERKKRGWGDLHVNGWIQPPAYDPGTHNLTWAIQGIANGSSIANYNVRLLGRQGVMSVVMVVEPDRVPALIPQAKQLASGCEFSAGNKYGEFREGDKIAEYGLVGLITGGAGVAAVKFGLLPKLIALALKSIKLIVFGFLAACGVVWKFITSVFGGRSKSRSSSRD